MRLLAAGEIRHDLRGRLVGAAGELCMDHPIGINPEEDELKFRRIWHAKRITSGCGKHKTFAVGRWKSGESRMPDSGIVPIEPS